MKSSSYLIFLTLLMPISSLAEEASLGLRDLAGDKSSIEQFIDDEKWLVVMIWATDCSVCFKEMANMKVLHHNHEAGDAKVLGVALDGFENQGLVNRFIEKHGLNFPNLIAEMPLFALRYEFEVGEALRGTPTYLLFSPDGELVANNPGPMRLVALEKFIEARKLK